MMDSHRGSKTVPRRHQYVPTWYENMERSAERSARAVLPIVIDIVRPQSVVDIGCGTGGWLKVLTERGVSDVVGVDGPTVPTHLLKITEQQFYAIDLAREDVALGRTIPSFGGSP
jgi:trans-aconitate methyltransferase